jgi:hypothetical protein
MLLILSKKVNPSNVVPRKKKKKKKKKKEISIDPSKMSHLINSLYSQITTEPFKAFVELM